MATVEAKDDSTIVVTYKKIFAPYLTRFPYILPAHAFDNKTAIEKSDFNRKPFGTGAFRVKEWKSGESVTYEKNTNYRVADKPALDGLVLKIVPSREAAIQGFQTNEVDVVWDLTEAQVPAFEKFSDATLAGSPAADTERIIFNLSNPSGDTAGDPAKPHPILGDLRVRQAIQYSINRKVIVDRLLFGRTQVGSSVLPYGWYATKIDPTEFSLDKAKALLDDAGWKAGADGIRAKDGVRMKLTFGTTSGNKLREQVQQVIQDQLKTVGIEVEIQNVPSSVLFGSWQDGSARKRGKFDMLMWTTGPGIDPDNHMFTYYHSSSIPSEANKGAGANYSRWKNSQVDDALDAASKTLDLSKRQASYAIVAKKITEELPSIQLYNRLTLNAHKKTLVGFQNNVYVGAFWNTQDWSLNK
jgi:peptide/nickel transport system substrate-binding protein